MSARAAHRSPRTSAFQCQPIQIAGNHLIADRSGALYWPSHKLLIVSDLHLEKGSARAARGRLLPPYDTRETLRRLAEVVDRHAPETVVSLGDSFHDVGGCARLHETDRAALGIIQDGRDWVWVTGNHDPEIADDVPGDVTGAFELDGIAMRHEPTSGAAVREIAGHLHPVAKLAVSGAVLRRACFISDGQRLVMPAFGAYTGGLNILDAAFAELFATGFSVAMRGEEGLYPVSPRGLRPD